MTQIPSTITTTREKIKLRLAISVAVIGAVSVLLASAAAVSGLGRSKLTITRNDELSPSGSVSAYGMQDIAAFDFIAKGNKTAEIRQITFTINHKYNRKDKGDLGKKAYPERLYLYECISGTGYGYSPYGYSNCRFTKYIGNALSVKTNKLKDKAVFQFGYTPYGYGYPQDTTIRLFPNVKKTFVLKGVFSDYSRVYPNVGTNNKIRAQIARSRDVVANLGVRVRTTKAKGNWLVLQKYVAPPKPKSEIVASLAPDSPVQSVIARGAAKFAFTKVNLKAVRNDVVVDGIVIGRTGLSSDKVFKSVTVLDSKNNNMRNGSLKPLGPNGATIFLYNPLKIKAGQTASIILVGNMVDDLSLYAGQTASLGLTGIVDFNGKVTGLPVYGKMMTLIGDPNIKSGDAVVSTDYKIPPVIDVALGTANIELMNFNITASSDSDLTFGGIQLKSSLQGLFTNIRVMANGMHVGSLFGNSQYRAKIKTASVKIKAGDTINIKLLGDLSPTYDYPNLISASFAVEEGIDLDLRSNKYGYYIEPSKWPNSTSPRLTGPTINISKGTLSVNEITLPNGKIREGSKKELAGRIGFSALGEDVRIKQMNVKIITPDNVNYSYAPVITKVYLYKGGVNIAEANVTSNKTAILIPKNLLIKKGPTVALDRYDLRVDVLAPNVLPDLVGTKFNLKIDAGDITAVGSNSASSIKVKGLPLLFSTYTIVR